MPSNNSNGNTFDFQGRQLSCEHLTRRVVRYEHDGSITSSPTVQRQAAQLAERRRPASGRQLLVHRSAVRRQLYEGAPDARAARATRRPAQAALGQPPEIGDAKRELPTAVYRVDPSGRVDQVVGEDQVPDPERPRASRPTTRSST
jgi:gluconolactonase